MTLFEMYLKFLDLLFLGLLLGYEKKEEDDAASDK